jgi:hypothetical protein
MLDFFEEKHFKSTIYKIAVEALQMRPTNGFVLLNKTKNWFPDLSLFFKLYPLHANQKLYQALLQLP